MQSFNPELKVGMLAMIIGCSKPENTYLIGTMVTVEAIMEMGETFPDQYLSQKAKDALVQGRIKWTPFKRQTILVSGVNTHWTVKENHASFNPIHLMPLPPLDDDVIIEATETPKETSKC